MQDREKEKRISFVKLSFYFVEDTEEIQKWREERILIKIKWKYGIIVRSKLKLPYYSWFVSTIYCDVQKRAWKQQEGYLFKGKQVGAR